MLIPHTLAVTTLGTLRPGSRVNVETDMIAKHVRQLMRIGEEKRNDPLMKSDEIG
jgi:riboflavin synthase